MSAMLHTLRGRPDDRTIPTVVLPARSAAPGLGAILARVDRVPEVHAAAAMRREAEAERDLAEKMTLPMVSLQATYEQRLAGERDTWGAGIMFSVPLWWRDRQRSEVAMADAMITRARREERAMRQMAAGELRMAWSRLRAAERRVAAIEERALPSIQETVRSTQAAYVAGRADFLVLLEALVALRELEMELLAATATRVIAQVELDRVAGAELEARAR